MKSGWPAASSVRCALLEDKSDWQPTIAVFDEIWKHVAKT